ncbi:Gamma-aminobutyric acid type B receptor subunit 2 [Thoreauomyces humboldtii]|nr:Gamma-aminobutyric acid type B receptor subunit 2 [Thoreauomyces humboldtii]
MLSQSWKSVLGVLAISLGLIARDVVAVNPQFKIAVMLDFTDPANTPVLQAIKLAAEELNTVNNTILPGLEIVVTANGTFGEPSKAISVTNRILNDGYQAVIGEEYSDISTYIGYALAGQAAFQCSGSATSPDLAVKKNYPNFFRVVPSDNAQATVILGFIQDQGWSTVAVFASSGTYAQGISDIIVQQAANYQITLSNVLSYDGTGPDDLNTKIERIKAAGSRIIILLCNDLPETLALTTAFANEGMVGDDFVYVGSDAMASVLGGSVNVSAAQLANLQGLFTTSPLEYSSYADGLRSRFQTKYGSSLDDAEMAAFNYDAVYSMAFAYGNLLSPTGTATAVSISDGTWFAGAYAGMNVTQFLTGFKTFDGATGPISFDSNGDIIGASFRVTNCVGNSMVQIATSVGGNKLIYSQLPTFYSGLHTPPSDQALLKDDVVGFHSPSSIAVLAIVSLAMTIILGSIPVLFVFRAHPILKPVSPEFMALSACGMAICLISIYVDAIAIPSRQSCNAHVAVLACGFGTTVGSILVKLVRLYRIFDNKVAQKQALNTTRLFIGSAGIVGIELLLVVIFNAAFPMYGNEIQDITAGRRYYECKSESATGQSALTILFFIYNAGLLISCCYLAFATRNIYSAFNECKSIGVAVYNIVFCIIVVLLVSYMGSTSVLTGWLVRSIVLFFAILVTYGAIIGRFLFSLARGVDAETIGMRSGSQSNSAPGAQNGRSMARGLNTKEKNITRKGKPLMASCKTNTLHVRGASTITTSQWRRFTVSLVAHPIGVLVLIKDKDPSRSLAIPISSITASVVDSNTFKITWGKGTVSMQCETEAETTDWVGIIESYKENPTESSMLLPSSPVMSGGRPQVGDFVATKSMHLSDNELGSV